jgi:phage host-nuclease inhibitor protein Gam
MTITSTESLDARVSEAVRLKLAHATLKTELETEIAKLQKTYAGRLGKLADDIAEVEGQIHGYCTRHRDTLFPEKKSRDSLSAVYGFELTPWRVETLTRKITWREVVRRMQVASWAKAYVRQPEPGVNKAALLEDRSKLSADDCATMGIEFVQEEQFFIRPKAEQAEDTTQKAVA